MNNQIGPFVKFIDDAIQVGNQRLSNEPDPVIANAVANVVKYLEGIKTEALNGTLTPSGGEVSLGLTREVIDWGESRDSRFLIAVGAVERYYRENL
jgi:hypothetical protein